MALLDLFPTAKSRFLESGEAFATVIKTLVEKNLFSGQHSFSDIMNHWQYNLMKIAFDLK